MLLFKYSIPVKSFKTYKRILGCTDYFQHSNKEYKNNYLTSNVGLYHNRYCSSVPPAAKMPQLMSFPEVIWPSLINTARNWMFANLIIRPHFDNDFSMQDFVHGTKQAVEVISAAMGSSDFSMLKDLVSPEAYEELHSSVSKMTVAEREQLPIIRDDIYFTFPFQVGIMYEQDNKRWVEITMCYHVLRGLKYLRDNGEDPPLSLGLRPEYQEKLFVLNYRFLREYTKGVDSSWVVNVVNHFKLADMSRR